MCDVPPKIPYGFFEIVESLVVGSVANYYCQVGFEITSSDNKRVCRPDLSWSGESPVCTRKFDF